MGCGGLLGWNPPLGAPPASCSSALLNILADRILRAKFSLEPTVLKPGRGRMAPDDALESVEAKLPFEVAVLGTGEGKPEVAEGEDRVVA